ncbi:MAG: helix-turn-helix transcriptional regulator [Lachnospiraceae bacterium]|jgi:predicted transcriptional regulator YheO|nr:helix-turn-helix transcriptional regulator [Lachnospiraceae bacterium]MCI1726579.1 helix-turn-helix transcriptional regulator [Lachnospiraceae bacterium]
MSNSRLTVLKQIAKGLAAEFGSSCEIVVHDLSRKHVNNSIVCIENGHVTNRKIGGGPSSAVLEAITQHPETLKDQYAYLTRTDNGRILKSTTIYVKDDDGTPKYILGINYDITNLLAFESSVKSLTESSDPQADNAEGTGDGPKHITQDVNELLDELIQQSVNLVGVPVPFMSKEDKIKAINFLNDAGAFLITKSGDKVSKYFGISKYTLYSYVDINK